MIDATPMLEAGVNWRDHAAQCRACTSVMRAGLDNTTRATGRPGTASLCPTGQRLHGLMQGHRARTIANGQRPVLNVVGGTA